jgi:hypothetical protein
MATVRDMAQGLLDRFAGFVRGHAASDRAHPAVGAGFIIAALLVLLLGLRLFSDSGGASGTTDSASWALDVPGGESSSTTTIGASPEAVAVRVGTAVPHGVEEDQSVTIGIPGTSIEIEIPLSPTTTTGPTGTGSGGTTPGGRPVTPTTRPHTPPTTRPGGGGTTTPPTSVVTTPTTTESPTTTEDPTTTTESPTTTEEITIPPLVDLSIELPTTTTDSSVPGDGGLLGAVIGTLGSLLG